MVVKAGSSAALVLYQGPDYALCCVIPAEAESPVCVLFFHLCVEHVFAECVVQAHSWAFWGEQEGSTQC